MNTIKQGLTEYRIPGYMEEILTHNYCPCFVRMSMIRDNGSYRFSYRPGNHARLDISRLSTYEKLILLNTIISISETASGYLIMGREYLIEPELVYTVDNQVTEKYVKLLFYPDVKKLDAMHKVMQFAERIRRNDSREDREVFDQLRQAAESDSLNRIKICIDKNIMRYESSIIKAG